MNQHDLMVPTEMMDLLPDTICMVDAQGRYVFVSAACERLLGYTQAELVGSNMIDLVHPEDREETLAAASEIMGGQFKMHFQNRYVRKDGRIVHIMWSARWSEDNCLRLAVARDITELKHAERMQGAIYRISEAAHDADRLADLYPHVHRIIGELLPAENFFVVLSDPALERISFPYFVDEREGDPGVQKLDARPRIAEVIRTGKPLLAPASSDHPDWLGVPLMTRSGVMGALVLKTYAEGVHYSGEDRELLQFVSTQVATAIERKQAESRLHHMAHYDPLTDLPNRTLFNDRFEMALLRAHRFGEQLALLVLDLDLFKHINDTLGHAVGDQVLRQVSRRLEHCLRTMDTVGRIGGDEFTVLLTDIQGSDDVDLIVEKIRAVLDQPLDLDGRPLVVSASIGSALYPEHGENIDQLFNHADAGMYTMKRRVAS
ncbi:diguanylate cyclase [Halomonas aestuarii]|uniref:Diguanylate cyclase n=1 Tax=Halomonas aestuarii TaxID=1897729 RepID=A0A1J0VIS0_9GAMM|nr:GGDEF domain-containing protein [Halomonas aestuarii]APE31903.1 diguanylate cyclase [Halomonas aestuarii]